MEIKVGDKWQHLGNLHIYRIRGISRFSCDGELDGKLIVEYEGEAGRFSSPAERFLTKFKLWENADEKKEVKKSSRVFSRNKRGEEEDHVGFNC